MKKGIFERTPLKGKRYLLTDQCFWQTAPQDYNPLDKDRAPHSITLVDQETGTIVMLKSGSIIEIVESK